MVYLKEHHEPIIDRDLWNRTQEELKRRSPSEEQKSSIVTAIGAVGNSICAECGCRYVSRTKKLMSGDVYKAWRCYAAANHGTKKQDADGNEIGCNNSSINDRSLKTCMNYCITLVQGERDSLKKEILKEISQLQKTTAKKLEFKENQERK